MADRKKDAKQLKPLLNMGKNGLTENFLEELDLAFKKRALVKIKLLSSCEEDVKEVAKNIVTKLKITLVDIVGSTITFYKKN